MENVFDLLTKKTDSPMAMRVYKNRGKSPNIIAAILMASSSKVGRTFDSQSKKLGSTPSGATKFKAKHPLIPNRT